MIAAAGALTAALAGLARMNVSVGWGPLRAYEHGPLFVLGVFGTVISLERAVALARPWAYLAPGLGAVGAVALLGGAAWAPYAASASCAALCAVNAAVIRRQSASFTWLMLAGSVLLLAGSVAWALGRPVFEVVPTWLGFFVLTIAAERLELSRLAPTPRWAGRLILVLAAVFGLSTSGGLLGMDSSRALGVSMALLGAWQLRFDLARRTVRLKGLPRFSALGVLLAAAWLVPSGLLLVVWGLPPAGPVYDAVLHGVLVGYVLSMIFAHAPIILPAVARVELPFHPALWAAPALLHAGLVARVAGDLLGQPALRQAGGIANATSLGVFVAAVLYARRARARPVPSLRSMA